MQIILSQPEIARALQLYIVKQGINTVGKDVSMQFTAGRKEQGITVQINIEDADIPGFGAEDPDFEAPVIVTEASEPVPVPVAAPVTQLRAAPELPAEAPFQVDEPKAEAKPVKKTVGSFLPEAPPPVITKKLATVDQESFIEPDANGNIDVGLVQPTPFIVTISEPTEAPAAVAEPKKTVSLFA